MRLTLRTLLAWLDDTLKPSEVREIGRHVADSPLAQELTERIQRVTRQRRLTVPSRSGPDGTDPNVVAAYLDNDLEPDAVAEFEQKCLNSDVNLAEVASVHQILSLLGQKVKVPAEARGRMYQLVKGRETNSSIAREAKQPPAPEPVTQPIEPWVTPEAPDRRWIERFGPAAACVALLLVAGWSAWRSLKAPAPEPFQIVPDLGKLPAGDSIAAAPHAPAGDEAAPSETNPAAGPETPAVAQAETPVSSQPTPAGAPDRANPVPNTEERTASKAARGAEPLVKIEEPAPSLETPAGASGLAMADSADGILLRYDNDSREWVRVSAPTPLNRGERLLCLAPSRALVTIGKVRLVLVGETEVRIVSQASDKIPAMELILGRALVRQAPKGPLRVAFADRIVTLDLSPEDSLTVARTDPGMDGKAVAQAPPLEIGCIEGEPSLEVGDKKVETLSALTSLTVTTSGKLTRGTLDAAPSWSTETESSAADQQLRAQFARMFHKGRPVLAEIVAASEDEHAEIKQLSISAIKALGDLSLLMPVLSRKDDPIARRSAIAAVRSSLARGPEALKQVRDQLVEEFGEEAGSRMLKMLVGYLKEEASSPELYKRLVEWIGSEQESVGLRELALDTLKRLTGREDLGYDPDHPQGKGLTAWKELLSLGHLHPPTKGAQAK